jgi:hypothetical protein
MRHDSRGLVRGRNEGSPMTRASRAVAVLLSLAITSPAFAGNTTTGSGAPSGAHFQFNIIGHPKGIKGDDSSGRAIMVPLKNASGPNSITCETDQVILKDDVGPTFTDQAPTGARIYFVAGDHFEIIDRDATDSNGATIMVPVQNVGTANATFTYDVFLRVLGKPLTCMDINAFAFDADQSLWFWAGSVDLNRQTGKSTFVKVNELFDVFFCTVDVSTGECTTGTTQELSVFNNVFDNYFWSILNNGTRLVQVRIYAR